MKKTLLVFCAACSMLVQAQTFMVNNFESAAIGSNGGAPAIYNGSSAVVANPFIGTLNPSANVLNVTNTGYVPVSTTIALPAGKTWADYDGVRVKLCPTAGADLSYANIEIGLASDTWSMTSVGSGNAWSTAALNTWYSCDIPFTASLLSACLTATPMPTYLLVKYNKAAGYNVLMDDIQLIEHQDPNRAVTLGYDDQITGSNGGVGVWYGAFGDIKVVDNPVTTGINTSSKAVSVTGPADPNGGALAINILPTNGSWNNYVSISFKILLVQANPSDVWFGVFAGGGPDIWTGGTSVFSNTLVMPDLNVWYTFTLPVSGVVKPLQPYLNMQFAKSNVIYLLDDISLNKAATGNSLVQDNSYQMARIASGLYQLSIPTAAAYKLVNAEGRLVRSGNFVAGSNMLEISSLSSGIYILQTTGLTGNNVVKIIR